MAQRTGRGRWTVVAALLLLLVAASAVVVGIGWGPEQRLEVRIERAVHRAALDHASLRDAARALTHLGDPLVVTAMTAVAAVVLLVRRRRRAALYVLAVRVVALLASTALKVVVDRPRPVLAHPLATAAGKSFPSGHAFGSAALWASLAVVVGSAVSVRARLALAVVVPVLVAATRVVLGVHFVTDVLAGLCLGWATALTLGAVMGELAAESAGMLPDD